jgi:NADH-quinone oxidoreductase subunit H
VTQQQYGIWNWFVFRDPFTFAAFWLYFTCATASCKRAPFDLAEAESELVAGFHTEYSGFRWLSIYMAEYGSMVVVSGLATIMFLGGWSTGLPFELATVLGANLAIEFEIGAYVVNLGVVLGNVINVAVFIFKCWFLVFIMMWIRWTLPRLRIDQVMMTCLKYILPMSCVLLVGVSLWRLAVPGIVQVYFRFAMLAVSLGLLGLLFKQWITWSQAPPATAMPGMWRTAGMLGYHGMKKT